MPNRLLYVLALLMVFFTACDDLDQMQSIDGLTNYVEDPENKLLLTNKVDDLTFQLKYYPKQLIISKELTGQESDTAKVKALTKKYADFEYFKLSISKNDNSFLKSLSAAQYSEYVSVFSFRMSTYVHMNVAEEKVEPIDFQFEQLYGLNRADNFLFVFAKKDLLIAGNHTMEFVLEDFGFGTGKQVFELAANKIAQINQLDINYTLNP